MPRRFARSSSIRSTRGAAWAARFWARCEVEARARGFRRFEMMATLPGTRLYRTHGYVEQGQVLHEVAPGLTIEFLPMVKSD